MQKGYFASDAAEGGLHVIFEKSLLSPAMWIFATLLNIHCGCVPSCSKGNAFLITRHPTGFAFWCSPLFREQQHSHFASYTNRRS
jgi:hypothetical protein